jgi:hypothetical protein
MQVIDNLIHKFMITKWIFGIFFISKRRNPISIPNEKLINC